MQTAETKRRVIVPRAVGEEFAVRLEGIGNVVAYLRAPTVKESRAVAAAFRQNKKDGKSDVDLPAEFFQCVNRVVIEGGPGAPEPLQVIDGRDLDNLAANGLTAHVAYHVMVELFSRVGEEEAGN